MAHPRSEALGSSHSRPDVPHWAGVVPRMRPLVDLGVLLAITALFLAKRVVVGHVGSDERHAWTT